MDHGQGDHVRDRIPKIPRAKVQDLKDDGPVMAIFWKADKDARLQCIDNKFPREAAMVFCDRIRHDVLDNNSKSFTITGGDLLSLKFVFAWIQACQREKAFVAFPEIDEQEPGFYLKSAHVIAASVYLGIPARDFAEPWTRKLLGAAYKVLMKWEEVDFFLYSPVLNKCHDDVRSVAVASIFWAWWNGKLTDEDTPEDMEYLSELRERDGDLDQALHDLCATNQANVEQRWAEKKAARAQAARRGGDGYVSPTDDAAPGDGWQIDNSGGATQVAGGWADDAGSGAQAHSAWQDPGSPETSTYDAAAMDNGDRAWDSGIEITTRESTPPQTRSTGYIARPNSPIYQPSEHLHGMNFKAPNMQGGGFNALESEFTAGDWAEEVNQESQRVNLSW